MRQIILLVTFVALATTPAFADDRALVTQYQQQMSDAIVPGDVAVWDRYLDPDVIIAEEDGSFKGKVDMLKEISPMPKGLGGDIKIELLSYHEDGDTAVALFREHETEQYFGQTIHASYLSNTTWKKRADGWKQIEVQLIAERSDPPAITLPAVELQKFVGTYKLKNSDPVYTLMVENGTLMGSKNGRKPIEWNSETRDVFFIKGDPRIRKIFQYDSSGKVTGFIERRESWNIVWVKIS